VLDFGLAQVAPPAAPDVKTTSYVGAATEAGVVLGTPGYMAPEQACGLPADCRCDLFSLGCVLFEMLTGRGPFVRASRADMLAALLHGAVPEMPGAGTRFPGDLARLVGRCLAREPTDRYQSAGDLAHDLRAYLSGPVPVQAPPARSRRFLLLAAGALLLGLAAAGLYWLTRGSGPARVEGPVEPAALDTVAVLPFENVGGDPAREHLSDGLSESVINRLSTLRRLKVRPFSAVARYRGQRPVLADLARDLKVQAVLSGRVQQQGDRLTVSVELVDVRDERQLWGERYQGGAGDVFAVQEEIARQIAGRLLAHLSGEEEQRLARRHTNDPEAFDLYLRGRHFLNSGDISRATIDRAVAAFERALKKDPNYALPHVGLADAWYVLSNIHLPPTRAIPEARRHAAAALALDDALGEAHALLGLFAALYDWDWPAAEREFRRALELAPGSAVVHAYQGLYLAASGQFDRAVEAGRRTLELDPSSAWVAANAIYPLYFAGRYDEAIARLEELLKGDPRNQPAQAYLGLALEQKGRFPQAIAAFQEAVRLEVSPEAKAQLGHAYALAGRTDDARLVLKELEELSGKQYVSPYNIALIHVGLNDRKRAFEWLAKAADDHSEWFAFLLVDPRLKGLRDDPHFAPLAGRLGRAP
jgi:serine/threonine-protein kinase